MKCPKCNNETCNMINEVTTTGKDFSAGKGICGAVLFGPIGILCGLCGQKKKTYNTNYWVCGSCGNKFRV